MIKKQPFKQATLLRFLISQGCRQEKIPPAVTQASLTFFGKRPESKRDDNETTLPAIQLRTDLPTASPWAPPQPTDSPNANQFNAPVSTPDRTKRSLQVSKKYDY